jgi:hypothetical protein
MSGTWVKDTLRSPEQIGVVKEIGDMHEGGSVVILWYNNSTEVLSTVSFRQKLQRGRYIIDPDQHPYDKVDWEVNR